MEKILLIDDEESILESLRIFLSGMNYAVSTASNGMEGIEIIHKEHPDLVITDLKMPEVDGLEVLKQIREFDDSVPCIIMTAYEDVDSTIRAMQLGAYDYIEKPIDTPRFKALIKRSLESQKSERKIKLCG